MESNYSKLFEGWRKFLLKENNDIELYNVQFLIRTTATEEEEKNMVDKFALGESYEEIITKMVSMIPPLKTNKLTKLVGAGMFGIAFKLDNDHILKLFEEDHSGDDLGKFRYMQKRQFSGEASATEPAIYDLGQIEVDADNGQVFNFSYVEMGRVIPFEDWMKANEAGQYDKALDVIGTYMAGSPNGATYSEFLDWIVRQSARTQHNLKEIPRKAIKPLFKSLIKYMEAGNDINDFHGSNFGVILNRNPNGEPTFVFFDV